MRVARVLTNETCNQNCSFCNVRRATERTEIASADAIRARIDQAIAAGASTVVLTGGEPTLRRDLAGIAAYARRIGARTLVLETNGALLTDERAAALKRAGVDIARVHLPAWGEGADLITRDPGGFARTRACLDGLARAGVGIEVSIPVVGDNAEEVAAIPPALAATDLPVDALILTVPFEGPNPDSLLPVPAALERVAALSAAAAAAGLHARLAPHVFLPPCQFAQPARVAHLYSMTRGGADQPGYARPDDCSSCAVVDRCPGLPTALGPDCVPAPISDDLVRRRLSLISSVSEQIERELVSRELYRRDDGTVVPAHTIRINFGCNQACIFCFVSTHLPAAPEAAVTRAIEEVSRAGGVLVISGGEPTLNPRLLDYVRLGKTEGARGIELQTNAIRLAEGGLAEELAEAGVTDALVSLHGSKPAISDGITGSSGSFARTASGIETLLRTDIRVRLSFVFCAANQTDFPSFAALVAQRWPGVSLTVSFVAGSTDVVPRSATLLPRYSDVLPHLRAGLEIARENGLAITGLDSMCGLPLCLAPGDRSEFLALAEIPPGFDRGEFVRPQACGECALASRCFGLRRGYAELHGSDELSPVSPDEVHGGSGTSSSS